MADKMGRWEVADGTQIFYGIRLVANTGGYSANYRPTRKENETNAKLIVALHNTALDVNESNPMAVAEGLPDIIYACKNALDYFVNFDTENKVVSGLSLQLNEALAAITKPANEEGK